MARYRIEKDGTKTLVRESTRSHPDGDRARHADGTPVALARPEPAAPTAEEKAPAKGKAGPRATARDSDTEE